MNEPSVAPNYLDAPVGSTERLSGSVLPNGAESGCELSVVIPCLNEHETIGIVVEKAIRTVKEHGIDGEVIVGDNGSTDGSIEIARGLGAKVVPIPQKGYGYALMGGIAAARGRYIIMGDADDSYDFQEVPKYLQKLREGYDLVQGCRLASGGGTIKPNAMPFLHYWVGNPGLTWLARRMFAIPIHDIYCGMRGFTKSMYDSLGLQCTGMEFATEMIIKANMFGKRIAEVPTTLYPDGRVTRRPHLRTFRDGWRTLRCFLLFSPKWALRNPSLLLLAIGALGYVISLSDVSIRGIHLGVQTLLISSLFLLMGFQTMMLGIFARVFAYNQGLMPRHYQIERIRPWLKLERMLLVGIAIGLVGASMVGYEAISWMNQNFGPIDLTKSGRIVVPGICLLLVGFNLVCSGFLFNLLELPTRNAQPVQLES